MSNKFDQYQPLAFPKTPGIPFKEARKEEAAHTYEAIIVTLIVPLIAGLLAFIGFALICWSVGWPVKMALFLSGISVIGMGIYWITHNETLMFRVEYILGADLNNDNIIGPPQKVPHVVVEAQREPEGNSWVWNDLPGDRRVIASWIEAAIKRQSLSVERWEPLFGYAISKYGKKISLYTLFKQQLDSREWLIDRGSHGVILSNEGKRILGNALEQLQVPLLTEGEEDGVV